MVSTPAARPVTVPPVTEALLLVALQAPPAAGSVSTIEDPAHTLPGPLIVPAVRNAPIDIGLIALAVPQLLVTVYTTVSVPGVTAVTRPDALPTVASVLVMLHIPPVAGSE